MIDQATGFDQEDELLKTLIIDREKKLYRGINIEQE
jgi:hypothetical protein